MATSTWSEMMEQQVRERVRERVQQAQREFVAMQLETRFGPLSQQARERLASWPADQLTALGKTLLTAQSLRELGLEE